MGLDITAYRQLKPVACDRYDECWKEHAHIHPNGDDFPGRDEGLTRGCHAYAEEFGFCAGSYIGYNHWREQLAALAQYPLAPDPGEHHKGEMAHAAAAWSGDVESGPFYELIDFSDCEGTIGPVVAKKLAADFALYQERANAHEGEYWRERYADWRKAFEMAADGGAVCFH